MMKLNIASTPAETENGDIKEQKARQGKQTAMTNFVRTLPVFSGRSFFFVKKKPKRMKMTVLQMFVQRLVSDMASASFEPRSSAKNVVIGIEQLPPIKNK